MSEQPADMTHELLRQIRAEQGSFREMVERKFVSVERRLDSLESDTLEIKRTLRGLTYMMATFNGRLEDLETRVDRLTPA
jgi:polyhydroxyalkanoate synthesis regulator phasin